VEVKCGDVFRLNHANKTRFTQKCDMGERAPESFHAEKGHLLQENAGFGTEKKHGQKTLRVK
jgi:hypothetical protein